MLLMSRSLVPIALGIALMAAPGALAQSQDDDPEAPRASSSGGDEGLLAGPEVEPEAAAGEGGGMGPAGAGGQRRRAESIPFRQWMQQVRELEGLTAKQQEDMALIVSQFQRAQREFQAAHADEMKALQDKIRAARESGREPESNLREQMQKLESEMPKPIDYQRQIWDLLDADQQESLRQRIAELERRTLERRRGGQPSRNADRAGEDMMTAEKPQEASANSGGEQMTGDDGQAGTDRPRARERLRQRRRAAEGSGDVAGLDPMARQRVEFLRQFISASSSARAGDAPSQQERTFKFDEDE